MTTTHTHTHHAHHHSADVDWDAMADHLEREAETHLPFLQQAVEWLRSLLTAESGSAGRVGRVLDVGSGPGVAAGVLTEAFPSAEVVAVDQSETLLKRARGRGAGKVRTLRADLPEEFGTLPAADVIWSSNAVHHLPDQLAALRELGARLRPDGLLAVVERGLSPRFLPRDIGMGRPGLQVRLEALVEEAFTAMRDELPGSVRVWEDWPALLAAAGLHPTGTRSFLIDLPAPLEPRVREVLHTRLTLARDRVGDRLDPEDREVLDRLIDRDAPEGILRRPDAFYLAASTVHTARAAR